jgi:hypothetical protein
MRLSRERFRIGAITSAAAALVLLAAAGAPTAAHGAAYEPNDSADTATGPLQSGGAYEAAIETFNDEDWFVFYTTGITQLNISLLGLGPEDCFGPEMDLTNPAGDEIDETGNADRNETERILYTAEKAETLYVAVTPYNVAPCAGPEAAYRLQVDSSVPLGLTPPPPSFSPPPPAPVTAPKPQGSDSQALCSQARQRLARLKRQMRRANSRRRRQDLRPRLRSARRQVNRACY